MKSRRRVRIIVRILLILFAGMNLLAVMHAYHFTHFGDPGTSRTGDETTLSASQKLRAVVFGVSIPRPLNDRLPDGRFSTVRLPGTLKKEAWFLPAQQPVGNVIVFHGFGGCRSGMLAKAERLRRLGYNCLLPDFNGSGGSEGSTCTIGYREAVEVRAWYGYLRQRDSGAIFLMGQSMGAVAVMKALHDDQMDVAGLILECPYGSMLQTVRNRFSSMGLPAFPMAQLLVFWGGTIHGFNAFSLRPESYATSLRQPVILIHGSEDPKVSTAETEAIFAHLAGPKQRLELRGAGHNDYLERAGGEWDAAVGSFLKRNTARPGISVPVQ